MTVDSRRRAPGADPLGRPGTKVWRDRGEATVDRYVEAMPDGALSGRYARAHWKCPDCFEPCRCVGPSRLAPHVRCGRSARDQAQFMAGDPYPSRGGARRA